MTYDEIFEAYYTLYRAEAEVPNSADDEYTIALVLANEAINQWYTYDNTQWKELFTTCQTDGTGAGKVVVTGQTDYDGPTNMQWVGGYVLLKDSSGNVQQRYPILEPQEVQFRDDLSTYCYFTGDPTGGFTLHLNPSPPSTLNGWNIDYVYYKKPTALTTGSSTTEMADPYFMVHRMLGNRFRASRNPYYNSALRDAEDSLTKMKMLNDSGNWANPWSLADNSGTTFGA